jgi:hypothetical protein
MARDAIQRPSLTGRTFRGWSFFGELTAVDTSNVSMPSAGYGASSAAEEFRDWGDQKGKL